MANLFGSLCLSDIPKHLITTARNGKKYLNIEVKERREPDKYGHTHYIKAYAKKDQVGENLNLFIGNLQSSKFSDSEPAKPAPASAPNKQSSDLPF